MRHVRRNRRPPCRTDHAYAAGTCARWPRPSHRCRPRGSSESGCVQSVSRPLDRFQSQHLRALGYIACVAKVPNIDDQVVPPLQKHEMPPLALGVARVLHENSAASIHEAAYQLPVIDAAVIMKISTCTFATTSTP